MGLAFSGEDPFSELGCGHCTRVRHKVSHVHIFACLDAPAVTPSDTDLMHERIETSFCCHESAH